MSTINEYRERVAAIVGGDAERDFDEVGVDVLIEFLSDIIYDRKADEAASLNSQGIDVQLKYLEVS